MPPTAAIVLAGGLGTRLRDAVPDRPKPIAEVAGRPFLAHLLDRLVAAPGLDTVILSVGYRHEMIRAALGDRHGRLRLCYSVEREPLGTGGGLRLALAAAEGEAVLVLNGDSLVDVDLAALWRTHCRLGRPLTLTAVELPDIARYGALQLDDDRLVGFAAKGVPGPGWINAGIVAMQRDLFDRWSLPDRFSFEEDILAARLAELQPGVHRTTGFFIDIGVPEDYARAQTALSG